MPTKEFSNEELDYLLKSPYIKEINNSCISFTDDFKRLFITERQKGKFVREIFNENGLDISIIGMPRAASSSQKWMKKYLNEGMDGLYDANSKKPGRQRKKELTIWKVNDKLRAENLMLKAENELLKKIDSLERGLRKKT